MRYGDVIGSLRESYGNSADERNATVREPWKVEERAAFLDRLRRQRAARLLVIGAGARTTRSSSSPEARSSSSTSTSGTNPTHARPSC
jgi:hypothetical protein